ncbi:peptidoglycan DD-metalloendopeptidase family protein [Alkalilimnicola ehrlichii MLHE-1]|uniref:Peptidase M23B n=1 Tax=Alkalilimnicola ehrlichii (strain ATCC BAA-1101 / DSM 17681 / MLHE-1) TaxID=187272 RepID=Q0A7L7_ALKEH|nr:peptidoglycan DD-metalloendopeptidase family protein [Alkalilimnicola ehrlichii]ABI57170.1 peptidase M23B [Alkalilimnicola ehrlichii MLHE-1]
MNGLIRLAWVALVAVSLAGCTTFSWPSFTGDGSSRVYHYEVRPGDTLYAISWRHGLDYRDVARWNNLESPDRIYAGQRLRLNPPGAGGRSGGAVASRSGGGGTPPSRSDRPATGSTTAGRDSRSTGTPSPVRQQAPASDIDWDWPVSGQVVKSFNRGGGKQGIEIRGREGDAIRAAAAGSVVYSGSALRGYGNLVIIKHDSRYLTAYGYNRRLQVGEGEQVRRGQVIAEMGHGPGADHPGLHFELRRDGEPVDPTRYLPEKTNQ